MTETTHLNFKSSGNPYDVSSEEIQVAFAVVVLVSCHVAPTPSGQDPAGNIERGRVRMDVTGKSGRIQFSDNDTRSP